MTAAMVVQLFHHSAEVVRVKFNDELVTCTLDGQYSLNATLPAVQCSAVGSSPVTSESTHSLGALG